MTYTDAKAQCESDGALLAFPRSDEENAFIASLIPFEHIWIGIDDIANEDHFVASDGSELSYWKWASQFHQPDNNNNGEDGVQIIGRYQNDEWKYASTGFWNDAQVSEHYKFVCSLITG